MFGRDKGPALGFFVVRSRSPGEGKEQNKNGPEAHFLFRNKELGGAGGDW